jgi:hypothetical protein
MNQKKFSILLKTTILICFLTLFNFTITLASNKIFTPVRQPDGTFKVSATGDQMEAQFSDSIIYVWEDTPRRFILDVRDNYDNYQNPLDPNNVKYEIIRRKFDKDGNRIKEDTIPASTLKEYLYFTTPNYEVIQRQKNGDPIFCSYYKYYYHIHAEDTNSQIIPPGAIGLGQEGNNITDLSFPIYVRDITPPRVKITFTEVGKRTNNKTVIALDYKRGMGSVASLSSKLYGVKPIDNNFVSSAYVSSSTSDDGLFPIQKKFITKIRGPAFFTDYTSSFKTELPLYIKGDTVLCIAKKLSNSSLNPPAISYSDSTSSINIPSPVNYLPTTAPANMRDRLTFWQHDRIKMEIKGSDN